MTVMSEREKADKRREKRSLTNEEIDRLFRKLRDEHIKKLKKDMG